MRIIETAAALCIVTIVSAHGSTTPASSLRQLAVNIDVPAASVGDVSSAEAARRHDLDTREDVPLAGQQCTPSPLWAREVDPTEYEIGCKEVKELLQGNTTLVGRGNIRAVYLAPYKGRDVAVKPLITTSLFGEHEHWLEMVASDAVKGKPHVVDMLGFCGTTVVTEAYGKDVRKLVRHAKEPIPIIDVVSISLDAAIGLRGLHEAAAAPIVHFDVKIDQLLVREDGRVSLADYNLAYFMGTNPDGSPCFFDKKGPDRIISAIKSPEYIAQEPLTEKVDIYRMGLIFAETLSAGGSAPFIARKGGTIWFDPTWNQEYVKVVQDMLGEVGRRPSASELVSRLEAIQGELVSAN
ncbi:unnamed protein product [Scytosiphon promiscuus]